MSLVFKYAAAARISMPGVRVTQEVLRARWIFPEIRKAVSWLLIRIYTNNYTETNHDT